MPNNQNAQGPDDVYEDPEVQAALNRLEAVLDESIEKPRRATLREMLGFHVKKDSNRVTVKLIEGASNGKSRSSVVVKPSSASKKVRAETVMTDAEIRATKSRERLG